MLSLKISWKEQSIPSFFSGRKTVIRDFQDITWTWNFELMRYETAFNVDQCNVPTHHGRFFTVFNLLSLLLSLRCLASLLSCNRKFSQLPAKASLRLQEAKLGWDWMLSSRGSLSGTGKQRMQFPTSEVLHTHTHTHTKQEVKNLNTAITGAVSLKLAAREECPTDNCCESGCLIWSFPFMVSKCCL